MRNVYNQNIVNFHDFLALHFPDVGGLPAGSKTTSQNFAPDLPFQRRQGSDITGHQKDLFVEAVL